MRIPLNELRREFEAAGITCVGNPDGSRRGREFTSIRAVIVHDTVSTRAWTAANVWSLLSHGRAGLPGPLANLSPDRSGLLWLVSDGVANHNGYGTHGNQTVGIEVQCAGGLKGHEEPWNEAQHLTVIRACQVLRRRWNVPILGHRESDPKRKIDPFRVDLDALRQAIYNPEEIDDMANYADQLTDIRTVLGDVFNRVVHLEHEVGSTGGSSAKEELDILRRSIRGPLREAVRSEFFVRGLAISTETETSAERIERIASEIEAGRNWTNFTTSLDGIVARNQPAA